MRATSPASRCAHRRRSRKVARNRRGIAVVELAVMLPLLVFLFLIAIDFARIYYYSLTIQNCARVGAIYAADPLVAVESPFTDLNDAALADAQNISPTPTVTQQQGVDESGHSYVEVTVAYQYNTIVQFPALPSSVNLERTVRMYIHSSTPNP